MSRKLISGAVVTVMVACLLPASALANPDWELAPLEKSFGEVAVGGSSSQIFTITNLSASGSLLVTGVQVLPSDSVFSQTGGPSGNFYVGPNATVDLVVTFTPDAVGEFSGWIRVTALDSSSQIIAAISGTGVETPPQPSMSVDEILAYFDASVGNGTLVGEGPGNSAEGRLGALRNQIQAAGDLIDSGELDFACQQLMDAYARCDGLPRPPDFVAGSAAPVLAGMIAQLMADLGC